MNEWMEHQEKCQIIIGLVSGEEIDLELETEKAERLMGDFERAKSYDGTKIYLHESDMSILLINFDCVECIWVGPSAGVPNESI